MLRIELINMKPIFSKGHSPFRIRTDAGTRRYSLVTNVHLPCTVGILTGIASKPKAFGLRKEAAHPNTMGAVVFGTSRCYVVVGTWVHAINASSTPSHATHVFGERCINNVWQLVLLPKQGAVAGGAVTVYYSF